MSAATTKRQLRQAASQREAKANTSGVEKPPMPFEHAPDNLQPFLDSLDTSNVYIIHLDTLPGEHKRKIFAVPVLLNLTIAILLIWRLYAIYPRYLDLLLYILGYESAAAVDRTTKTWLQLVWITVKRTSMFLLDFVLIKFILPWPITFFFEAPANPVSWRRRIGFQNTEIIVRVSRKWGNEDMMTNPLKRGQDSPFFKVRIVPAVEEKWLREKTGYLMMGKDWDLDFAAMIQATRLVVDKKMQYEDFQTTVLAWDAAHEWLAWKVGGDQKTTEEEARDNLVAFKDKLTLMGKESLFFRWVEMIQYESSQPGEVTLERRANVIKKARELFENHGVDFDAFSESVGGIQGFPGLEQVA